MTTRIPLHLSKTLHVLGALLGLSAALGRRLKLPRNSPASDCYLRVPLPSIACEEPPPIWIRFGLYSSGLPTRISRTPLS